MIKNIILNQFCVDEKILKSLVGATITRASCGELESSKDVIFLDLEKDGKKLYLSFDDEGLWHYGEDKAEVRYNGSVGIQGTLHLPKENIDEIAERVIELLNERK